MNSSLLTELRNIVGPRNLITSPEELHTYDSDALTYFRTMPQAVLLPNSTAEVQAILRLCHREKLPFVARGSGTSSEAGNSQLPACVIG
jgi:glycolate oxidase